MAEHKKSRAKVAIKQIDRKVCPSELLVKEVQIMRSLGGCKGVIQLLDVYEDPNSPKTFLVMELVTGGELFDYIVKSSSYSEKSASDYIRQLCQTVEYLHSKNIVHRDLKPENMLFEDPSAQVLKLCDFGLADTLKDDFDFLTLAVGTKSYMAPEVSSNMGYGKPVDMYSIGVILYILLCGYLPIDPENGICVLEFPPSEWADISIEVKLLIKRLLDDSPAARPTASVVLKHPWIRGTNTSTKPLVGTVRNLKSWNQVGGRAITKPRGQVMNLFDNPPPGTAGKDYPATDDSLTSSSSQTVSSAASVRSNVKSPKAKRAASPKTRDGRMQKTKKAALPKMIDGVMTPPQSPSKDSSTTSKTIEPSSPTSKRKEKEKDKEKDKERAKTPKPARPVATTSGTSATAAVASPKVKKVKKVDKAEKAEKAEKIEKVDAKPSKSSAPVSLDDSSSKQGPSASSSASSVNASSSNGPMRSNGESKPISDRTKQFLKEQDARAAAKKEEATEKSNRRRSMGTPSRKRAVDGTATIDHEAVKKEKKPLTPAMKEKKAKRKSVAVGRPLNDLEAMISSALDESDDALTRQRSNSIAGLAVHTKKKKKPRGPDLIGGKDISSNESLGTPKKSKTRERSATTQQNGDFTSVGSDSALSVKKGSKTTMATSNPSNTSPADSGDEFYPKRSSSRSGKKGRPFASPANASPPDEPTPLDPPSSPAVLKVSVRKAPKSGASSLGSPSAINPSRSSGNLRSNTPNKSKIKIVPCNPPDSDSSDSDSYATGKDTPSSASSNSSDVRLLRGSGPHSPTAAKKKKPFASKRPPSRSPSTSSD